MQRWRHAACRHVCSRPSCWKASHTLTALHHSVQWALPPLECVSRPASARSASITYASISRYTTSDYLARLVL